MRLNHAVLFVRDLDRAVEFYTAALGFHEIARDGVMAFLRAEGSPHHHELGLFAVGAGAPQPPRGSTGLFHLAWEVATIEDLGELGERLGQMRALTGASDHGTSKSFYGADPDGNQLEVTWEVPRHLWTAQDERPMVAPLDLARELSRFGTVDGNRPLAAGSSPVEALE